MGTATPLSHLCKAIIHCVPAVSKSFGLTENAVVVVGAGIAGLSTAASLHKVNVTLFDPYSNVNLIMPMLAHHHPVSET